MFNRYLNQASQLYVPLTDNRYQANLDDLSVSDNDFVLQTQINQHGQTCVELDWYAGRQLYPVSKVIAHTFKPTTVPTKYWDQITVEFADSNPENLHPENLVWRFPKMLGSEDSNGFGYIPMYCRYMISREGTVFDTHRKRFLKATYSQGYFKFELVDDLKNTYNVMRHRLVGYVFLDYPSNVDSMTINHINGIRGDDSVENLEWMTVAENIRHAVEMGLKDTPKPVMIENLVDGGVKVEFSLRHCSKAYNVSKLTLAKKLTQAPWFYQQWPYRFSFKDEKDREKGRTLTKALVRNMRDGSVTEYASLSECAKVLGLTLMMVNARINSEHDRVFPDGLQIRRKKDVVTWHEPEDVEKAIAQAGGTFSCDVRDCLTGEVSRYSSQEETSAALGIGRAAMHVWLSFEGKRVFRSQRDERLVQVRRCSVLEDWVIPEDPQMAYDLASLEKRVIVRDILVGKDVVYESAVQCAAAHQILTTTLNYRLSMRGQKLFEYKYQFKYTTDPLEFKHFNYVPPPRKRVRKTSLTAGKLLRASNTKSV